MFTGETITTGAAATCSECGETPEMKVYSSPGGAGYYIGTYCQCGPYSRESDYFKTAKEADAALVEWKKDNKVGARTAEFNREGAKTLKAIPLEFTDKE